MIVTVENGRSTFDVNREKPAFAKTDAGCPVTFTLTRAQTLPMHRLQKTRVQLRAKDADGHAIATEVASVNVEDIVKDGEI